MAGEPEGFGGLLRRHREAAGYSQEQLAERAGLSANAVSALERGERKRPYPDTVRRLSEALGLSEEARSELVASLRGDAPLAAAVASPSASPAIVELPGEPTPLLGRAREAEVVRILLGRSDARLLTLVGPGGVGKTRLALHVARSVADRYPDGVGWVDLAPLRDAALVLPTVSRALSLEEPRGGDVRAALHAWLRQRRVLLVLDNVEHLLDAATDIAELLRACPELHLLATSRAPLSIRGEQEYVVPPLELPPAGRGGQPDELATVPAVELFAWYARQRHPSFAVTKENAAAMAAICRRLDGLPLALELVAARVRLLGPDELLARLDRLLPLLVGGSRDLPRRQQTMRAAIEWSYDLLGPAEQALFRRLSVFAGGWTLAAAEAVGPEGAADDVFDRLGALVEQSLVTVTHDETGTRYTMLEPVRQYALERLETGGEADATRQRHASFFLALAEHAALELEGRSEQVAWLERLEREHDNLRGALAWSEAAPAGAEIELRLASALWRFWEVRGHTGEGGRWLSAALARSDGLSPLLRARVLTAAGNLARDRADYERATAYHEQSLELWRGLGDRSGIASTLNNLSVIARDRGDAQRTERLGLESLALYRAIGEQHGAAIALISIGMAASQQGNFERARSFYGEGLALFRASGDSWHTAWVLNYLARLMVRQGDVDAARCAAEESLALYRTTNDDRGVGLVLGTLGRIAQTTDDLGAAAGRFADGLRLVVGAGFERAIPGLLEDLAGVASASDQPGRAARLGGAAETMREIIGVPRSGGDGIAGVVDVTGLRTDPHAAAWVNGRALTREQAVAEALALAEEIARCAGRQPSALPARETNDAPPT